MDVFYHIESRAHLFCTTQVWYHTVEEKKRDWSIGIPTCMCVWERECVTREEREREKRSRGRQWLSQPSHDLIKAIHHVWIIRQQHGSHDQYPSHWRHTLTHPHSHPQYFYTNMPKLGKKTESGISTRTEVQHRALMLAQNSNINLSAKELGAVLSSQPELVSVSGVFSCSMAN